MLSLELEGQDPMIDIVLVKDYDDDMSNSSVLLA
jgi:hypothetical protein